ncbi:MAG: hypothetical protein Q7R45_08395 [Sulfuricaulis sp.]|nr:hypothetical protein [Sulfuricaulis sp.]
MDWTDIGKTLLGFGLPTLGTALGGPLGGVAGKMLADALKVPATPQAVDAALRTDPQAQIAASNADAEWAKAAGMAEQAAAQKSIAVNDTMRAELAAHQPPWHGRNVLWYVFDTLAFGFGTIYIYAMGDAVWSNDTRALNIVVGSIIPVVGFLSLLAALLGYVVSNAKQERTAAVTGEHAPTMLGTLIGTIRGN